MKYFLAVILPLTFFLPCRGQKVSPLLHLVKGNTYYMSSSGTSEIVQSLNGRENKVVLSLASRIAFKVTGISNSVYDMEVSYQSLKMKIQMAGATIDMDSKKNDVHDIPSSIIAAMMNKPFNITLSRQGKIRSVQNVEQIIDNVFTQFRQVDTMNKEQLKSQLIQSFGPNAFKNALEMGTAVFPGRPVSKNDQWTITTTLDAPAKAKVETTYQLIDIAGDFYQVHGDGVVSTGKNDEPTMVNGMPVIYKLDGNTLTDIKINKDSGWISEVDVKQLMSGNIEIKDNPKMPGGMIVPVTFNTQMITNNK